MYDHPFPPGELDARVAAVRSRLAAHNLDGIVISVPENIYYLTGLDHWGFFACHLLIVPRDGELILTCRAMEGSRPGTRSAMPRSSVTRTPKMWPTMRSGQ